MGLHDGLMLAEAEEARYLGWKSNRGMEVDLRYCLVGVMEVVLVVVGIHHGSVEVADQAEARSRRLYETAEGLVEEGIRCYSVEVAVPGVVGTSPDHGDMLPCCAGSRQLRMDLQCFLDGRLSVI